jgi:hypothetical protein
MANSTKPLSPDAATLAEKYKDEFYQAMMEHAQTLATKRKDEMILSNHIRESREFVIKDDNNKSQAKKIATLVVSTIFGVTLPSFFTELSALTANPPTGKLPLVILYFILSLVTLAASIYLADLNTQ